MELICTIGPRAKNVDDIKSYIENGMTIPRFNFSHADYDKFDLFLNYLNLKIGLFIFCIDNSHFYDYTFLCYN